MYDIIPDIHGHAEKLTGLLTQLGYRENAGVWRHSNPNRTVVFLGDFIDRGPENAKVIRIVRSMIDAGTAQAVMGNHELNAIHFHTSHTQTGEPLRPHSEKNLKQHGSFLAEHQLGSRGTQEAISWMRTLPLYLELDGFRAVHACWSDASVQAISQEFSDRRLTEEAVHWSADKSHPLYLPIETLTKGPEAELPDGYSFKDIANHKRTKVRLAWWRENTRTWKDISISVPNADRQLPDEDLPAFISTEIYKPAAKPVFFGHYWMQGDVVLQSPNTLCLDYSAGLNGPLVSYQMEPDSGELSLVRLTAYMPTE